MNLLKAGVRRTRTLAAALAALALLALATLAVLAQGEDSALLSVKLRAGLSPAEQAAAIAAHGGVERSAVAPLRIRVLEVPAAALPAALDAYRADPRVESVEAVGERRAEWLPDDPDIATQWALERIGWEPVYSSVVPAGTATVALLDTGVDGAHPELSGAVLPGASFIDGTDGRSDPSGHGTALAGLIAAAADNGQGIAGVAYAGVKILPVAVLDAAGRGPDSAIVAGIVWAADRGADVIVMGFSSPTPSQHLQDAIDYAWSSGAVLVAAAGNDGADTPTYPAANRGVLAISASDRDDGLAPFSNRGRDVFLAAPGVDLLTTGGAGGYGTVDGTSAAAALVGGAAALLKAIDPSLANGVLIGRLARGAAPVGDPEDPDRALDFGYGRLSLSGALADAEGADADLSVEPLGAVAASEAQAGAGAGEGDGGQSGGSGGQGAGGGATPGTGGEDGSPYAASAVPTVSILASTNQGANQVTLNLQSSQAGTGYFTLLPGSGAACGTGAQVKAGLAGSGAQAARFGSLALAANTAASYTVRNLSPTTFYTICFTAQDASALLQGTPATASALTAVAANLTNTWGAVGSPGFSAGTAESLSLAFAPDGTPYVVYQDTANGWKATVMRYSAGAWSAVGSPGLSAGGTNQSSLAFAPDGTPYVGYRDWANGNGATVMRFSGGVWTAVGTPGFSAAQVDWTFLAFAPDGTPYLAFRNLTNGSKATVMRFSAGSWSSVGSLGISPGRIENPSLAFAPDGTPYLAYADGANAYRATVMRYSGGAWSAVGSAGFSAGQALYTSLAFAPDGTPYVAYQDWPNAARATVMRYSGGAWSTVGSAGFSAAQVWYTSLAFAPDGTPYLAYTDNASGVKAKAMRYSAGAWRALGSVAGISAGDADYTFLAVAPDGSPYLAYQDSAYSRKATVMRLGTLPATTTALVASPNPAAAGSPVTFTATVTPAAAGGTVVFKDGNTTLGNGGLSGGTTRYITSALAAGSHSIYAVHTGTPTYSGSASSALTLTVVAGVAQTIAFPNPGTQTYGSAPTLAASASSGLAVVLRAATPEVCTVTVGGTLTFIGIGTCRIDADQGGDATYAPAPTVSQSFSVAAKVLAVASPAVTTKVYDGTTAATFTGTLVGIVGTDQVTLNGTGTFAGANVGNGIAVTSTATLGGTHAGRYSLTQPSGLTGTISARPVTVTADAKSKLRGQPDPALTFAVTAGRVLSGDAFSGALARTAGESPGSYPILLGSLSLGANYALSFVGADLIIDHREATETAVSVATNPVAYGAAAVVTATVSPAAASGSVAFTKGGTTLAAASLSAGVASAGIPGLGLGSHTIVAVYAGDGDHLGSSSAPLDLLVEHLPPTPTILPATNLGANQVTLNLHSNISGTGWFTLLAGSGAACGTGAQVKAGLAGSGAAAMRFGTLGLAAGAPAVYTVRNLSQSTTYTVCFTAEAATGLLQGTPTTDTITTAAPPAFSANWTPVGSAGFSAGSAFGHSLAFAPDGTPYVAYADVANGNRVAVMRYSSGVWSAVGSPGAAVGEEPYLSLAFAPEGTPCLAFAAEASNPPDRKASVTCYSGGSWRTLGSARFSAGWALDLSLAFGADGTPYVAYREDMTQNFKATVMRFSAGSWSAAGSAGPSPGAVAKISNLTFGPDGAPYVAFHDDLNGEKITVMRFSAGAWSAVGSPGFTHGFSAYTASQSPLTLAIAPNGTPHLVFREYPDSTKATVMSYSAGAWSAVGGPGFSVGWGTWPSPSLAFAADGAPYVGYTGGALRYSAGAWGPVVSLPDTLYPDSLVFAPDGTPYLACRDQMHGGKTTVIKLVPPAASAIALTASPNPATFGAGVTLTATVSPAAASGTVTFKDGATTLGTASLSGGSASFTTSSLAVGSHGLAADYGGDSKHLGSGSGVQALTVAKASQILTFANPGTQTYGSAGTLTASAGSGLAVAFASATPTVCAVTAGGALSLLDLGTCTVHADQAGNANYAAAPTVTRSFPVTAKAIGLAAPAVVGKVYDGSSAATLTGTLVGVVGADQVTLNGTGTFASANAGSGIAVTATATLGGTDAGKYSLTQPTGLTGTIAARPVTVAADPRVKTFGEADPPLTYRLDAGSPIGGDTFAGALARAPGEGAGTYPILQGSLTLGANYALGFVGANLTIGQAATATALGASPNPAVFGDPVTFTATLTPATATGSVTFKDGATALGSASLSGGTASFSTSALAAGNRSMVAVYSGDTDHAGSTSPLLVQTVRPLTAVTVATAPAGLAVTVDGQTYTAPRTFHWLPGSAHAIGVVPIQGESGGTRSAFANWSDGGAASHAVVAPDADSSYTARFDTQHRLTVAVGPAGHGTVSPAAGGWYAAGTSVTVAAFADAGYALTNWSGPVANALAPETTVTMGAPAAVEAAFAGSPLLTASIIGKSGPAAARVWTLRLRNIGQAVALGARIDTLVIAQQTSEPGCAPSVVAGLPRALGNIAAGGDASGTVTINFGTCTSAARYQVVIGFSSNGSAVTPGAPVANQTR